MWACGVGKIAQPAVAFVGGLYYDGLCPYLVRAARPYNLARE